MRLIDADVLMEAINLHKRHIELVRNARATRRNRAEDAIILDFADMVKNAPTADRPQGEWQITEPYPHTVYCSECHTKFAQTHWSVWEDGSLPRNFCPKCGAKMGTACTLVEEASDERSRR